MEILKKINLFLVLPLVGLIWVYQRTLSPDYGPFKGLHPYGYCKFYPTCSEYARLTLLNKGLIGLPQIFKRIAKCNPLSTSAVDLPKL